MRPILCALLLAGCASPQSTPRLFDIWTVDHANYHGESEALRRKPPCAPAEREHEGLCWMATTFKPPCYALDVEVDGVCLIPTYYGNPNRQK